MTRAIVVSFAVLAAVACGTADRPPAEAQSGAEAQPAAEAQGAMGAQPAATMPADVALAVRLARAIQATPAAADSILAANGVTRTGLDSLMYTIAADPAKAAAYDAALR